MQRKPTWQLRPHQLQDSDPHWMLSRISDWVGASLQRPGGPHCPSCLCPLGGIPSASGAALPARRPAGSRPAAADAAAATRLPCPGAPPQLPGAPPWPLRVKGKMRTSHQPQGPDQGRIPWSLFMFTGTLWTPFSKGKGSSMPLQAGSRTHPGCPGLRMQKALIEMLHTSLAMRWVSAGLSGKSPVLKMLARCSVGGPGGAAWTSALQTGRRPMARAA